jgi:hypothetical protein
MGNHDTSVINNSDVMKDGKEMNQAMLAALDREFAQDSQQIILALRQFLFSQPLAVKCENRIWISHSLPNDRYVDVVRPNSAYLLTWGRNHSQETLDKLAEMFDVDVFILGHQPQSEGWGRLGENLLVLTSEHNHGTLLPLDLSKSYTLEELLELIVPLASIA